MWGSLDSVATVATSYVLFCVEHRYSDCRDCSYDYKAARREAIARENPVVKAAKIVKV